jgi:hypothetical protein
MAAIELTERVERLRFEAQYSGKRPAIWLENCAVECARGYQLCTFFRGRYIAFFSLPDLVPTLLARIGVEAALDKFLAIDKKPHLTVREQQFVVYRAYLNPVGHLTVTQHVINGVREGLNKP